MELRGWQGLFGLGCLLLAGCAGRTADVTPAEAVSLVRSGRPLLNCRDACLGAWRQAQPQAARLAAAGQWAELAALVLRADYQDDLTLYYLARAAEGLGAPVAAGAYYRESLQLSGTSLSCRYLSRLCGGLVLPRDALRRLAVVDRELGRRYRRPPPGPRRPEAAPIEPGAPAVGDEAVGPSARDGPAPPPPAGPPPVSDYIEPPPVVR
jgi:hypothetical protein